MNMILNIFGRMWFLKYVILPVLSFYMIIYVKGSDHNYYGGREGSFWSGISYPNEVETYYSLPSELNVCQFTNREYHLEDMVTYWFRASTDTINCILIIHPRLSPSWFKIDIIKVKASGSHSYLIVEETIAGKETYKSFPLTTCSGIVQADLVVIVLSIIEVEFYVTISQENSPFINSNAICNITSYDDFDVAKDYVYKADISKRILAFGVSANNMKMVASSFDNVFCPEYCFCILGHKKWNLYCWSGEINLSILLICNPSKSGLSFLYRQIDILESDAFWCYGSLRKLILKGNRISHLPKHIFDGLYELRFLDFSHNDIQMLQNDTLQDQVHLMYLILEYNKIPSLPSRIFSSLNKLLVLDLGNNLLSLLPETCFDTLEFLTELYLNNNDLEELSGRLFHALYNLEALNLKRNNIKALESFTFAYLPYLQELHLKQNSALRHLYVNTFFTYSEQFIYLDLKSCGLHDIDSGTFNYLYYIKILHLEDNNIVSFPNGTFDHMPSLQFFSVKNNKLNALADNVFLHNVHLQFLYLHDNALFTISSNVFKATEHILYALTLHSNEIHYLPDDLFDDRFQTLVRLDLSDNYLSYVPNFRLKSVNVIYLQRNQLQKLTSEHFNLTLNLLKLDLSHNKLTELPTGLFSGLTKLEYIYLQHNNFARLPSDLFNFSTNLIKLDLSHNKLTELPTGLFSGLTKLEYIYLQHNNFARLPSDLFNFSTNLIKLDISNNEILNIPTGSFNALNKFKYLYLHNNHITKLQDLNDCINLKSLLANHNKITEIEEGSFINLNQLKKIYLNNNQLRSLPNNIFENQALLEDLDLNFNYLVELPSGLFNNLAQLTTLQLADNPLANLPSDMFEETYNLTNMYIKNTNLTVFPNVSSLTNLNNLIIVKSSIQTFLNISYSLNKLRALMLFGNLITYLPYGFFDNMQELLFLDLSENRLSFLTGNFLLTLMRLDTLKLGNNNFEELPVELFSQFQNISVLQLHYNGLTELHTTSFEDLTKLIQLFLHGNSLIALPSDIFATTFALRFLRLDYNKLTLLPNGIFDTLTSLNDLHLNYNLLQELPSGLLDNCHLNFLSISNNHLSYLASDLFTANTELRILRICCNSISRLPPKIFTALINLQQLDVSDNFLSEIPSITVCNQMHYLKLSNNLLSQSVFYKFGRYQKLYFLALQGNNIEIMENGIAFESFTEVKVLFLNSNLLTHISPYSFKNMKKLRILNLSHNRIEIIEADSFYGLESVSILELQHNNLVSVEIGAFQHVIKLDVFNVSANHIQTIYAPYKNTTWTNTFICDIRLNPLNSLHEKIAMPFGSLTVIVDEYASCCFLGANITCLSTDARPSFLTCRRLLSNAFLRYVMWIVGIMIVLFNVSVILSRFLDANDNKVQNTLILNLGFSDFLMGLNLIILTSVDMYYADYFPNYSASWIKGILCKIAAGLSTLSSEVSVGLILLIALDRFLGVRFPLGVHRGLGTTRMRISIILCWSVALSISIIPIIVDIFSTGFFEVSEVCVGLPLVKRVKTSETNNVIDIITYDYDISFTLTQSVNGTRYIFGDQELWNDLGIGIRIWLGRTTELTLNIDYKVSKVSGYVLASLVSIIVFIGVNITCFIAIAVFYIQIFLTARASSKNVRSNAESKEFRMAVKMSAVVFTDFCCWVPLALVCLLVQCGAFSVRPEMYAWTVGFLLPINSALNPFLYTLANIIGDRIENITCPCKCLPVKD